MMTNSARLRFVVAGDTKDTIEKNCGTKAWRNLADNGFIERVSVSCVGFHREIEENTLLVVLPKAFNSPGWRSRLSVPAYEREQIYRLIRIFKKVRRESQFAVIGGATNQMVNSEVPASDPVLDSFEAALRILADYRDNGLYVRRSPRQIFNKPNISINWSRTISNSSMILNDQEAYFEKTIHFARKRDFSHPLCLLHISCLAEIFSLTGERNELEGVAKLDLSAYRKIKENSKKYLRDLRASTFDERGRFLISAIGSFFSESRLRGTSREVREDLLSYTKDFEDIWEKVLRDLISPSLKNRTLPAGKWVSWPDISVTKGMQPELDIRTAHSGLEVLVDAKDYRLLNGAKLQGSNSDYYKQIIYRQLLTSRNNSNVVNILAFPSLGQKSLFLIRGCHFWSEIQGSRVFEVTVDYDLAVKRWLGEASLNVKEELDLLLTEARKFSDNFDSFK